MAAEPPHILVVDDDNRLRTLLGKYLRESGFMVSTATDAKDARAKLEGVAFDLIILDLMMPGEHGLDFARDLRRKSQVPILMLTAMGEPDDRIAGLERGADDYLGKPFEPRELILRIHNILKRVPAPAEEPSALRLGTFIFDPRRRELSRDGRPIRLTEAEAQLLALLAERPGEVFARDELVRRAGGGDRAVDVQVTRLRRKLEDDPKTPRYLQTVRGRGYLLQPD